MNTAHRRILLITDSLAFPRVTPEFVRYEDTYVALLKRRFPDWDFIHVGRGGATIVDLYKHTTYFHGTINPDLVIMQCGIVDCAPRTLTQIEQQILLRVPPLKGVLGPFVKRFSKQIRRIRKITYTPLPVFSEYVKNFEALYGNVHWIEVLPASEGYDQLVCGVSNNINEYNKIIRSRKYISTENVSTDCIMTDFHHLNVLGHRKIFEKLAELMASEFQS